MRYAIVTFLSILFFVAKGAQAGVRITEIAWMGTLDSQFAEWFELYNDGATDENLAGWKLYEDTGAQVVFTFSKTIKAGEYLLVERTTPSTPDPVPGIDDETGSFGGSGFSNTGEDLTLEDANGSTIQSLSFASGWPAGDASTKDTMQWDGTKWVTAKGTPKAPFITDQGGGSGTTSSSTPSSSTATTIKKSEPKIELSIPKNIYTQIPYEYTARTILEYEEPEFGVFLWNMGDGTVYKFDRPTVVKHSYQYPGTYTITFAYYRASYEKKPLLMASVERTVSYSKISLQVVPQEGLQFGNADTVPVDISGWIVLFPDGSTIELPPFSIIGAKKTVIMPFAVLGVTPYASAILKSPNWVSLTEGKTIKDDTSKEVVRFIKANTLLAQAKPVVESLEELPKQEEQKNNTPRIRVVIFIGVLILLGGLFFYFEKKAIASQQE